MNIQHICVHHVSLSAIEDTTIFFGGGGGGADRAILFWQNLLY